MLALLLLVGTLAVGARRTGAAPPLGPLLDPANGVWALARTAELPRTGAARIPGLAAPVRVLYDDRGVPHIFATSEGDAYRALGYVVARDRLFQMELQTRATEGRLSEWGGDAALPLDHEMRQLGLPRAARRTMAALDTAAAGSRALAAYADGVNAWIAAMRPADVPLEYRLLGVRPARWAAVNSALLLHRMGWTLASDDPAMERLRAAALVGDAAASALVPMNSPLQEPIVPAGGDAPRLDTSPLPPPGAPDSVASRMVMRATPAAPLLATAGAALARRGDALGSNNWAVAPWRTQNGRTLLAGDPHLELTLPPLWYEAHLVVPGRLDVYGVTIPGLPFVVLGFNRDIAWSFTNTGADVLDRYAETVDDSARPTRYLLDGAWRALTLGVERYRGRGGELLRTDTVRFTHRGPLVRSAAGGWMSLRWTVLDPSTDADAAVAAARARSAAEFQRAMVPWVAPAQTMLVADRAGTIAVRSTGRFPLRPGNGRGDVVRDGRTSASDWTGAWPVARYPASISPARGYLFSANQQPVDPAGERPPGGAGAAGAPAARAARGATSSASGAYLGAAWPAPWRAIEIARLLGADSALTPDAMRRMQTDPASARADWFVPALLAAAQRALGTRPTRTVPLAPGLRGNLPTGGDPATRPDATRPDATRPDATLADAARVLGAWDRRYSRSSREAVLFELAMREVARRTWDELVPRGGTEPVAIPGDAVLARLLADSASPWWDDRATAGRVERRDDILAASLRAAFDTARRRYGPPGSGGWRWDRIRQANVWHLLRLRALSALGLRVSGGTGTISPLIADGRYGASWRMVVELGPTVRAWGIYPGGQSGNPASSRYLDRLPRWVAGALDTLRFPARAEELPARQVTSRLTLEPAP